MLGRKQTDTELVVRYLAVNVRRLRLHLGLSVAQLAKRTFMDECQLGRIERTSKSITVATAVRLADGLGFTAEAIVERYNKPSDKPKGVYGTYSTADPEIVSLAKGF